MYNLNYFKNPSKLVVSIQPTFKVYIQKDKNSWNFFVDCQLFQVLPLKCQRQMAWNGSHVTC